MNLLAEQKNTEVSEEEVLVIVVGSGPVGIQFVKTMLDIMPKTKIKVFGNEPWEPYNRVKLSSFFAGELQFDELLASQKLPDSELIEVIHNCAVTDINRSKKTITDEMGREHAYQTLVLATGSRPFIPNIDGIGLKNIYTFRDMSDVENLFARRASSRSAVIVGGGVLGIEAARAMSRENTQVRVIDHLPVLMSHQLDEGSSEILHAHLISEGISLNLGTGIREFVGSDSVEAVVLKDGTTIECDTVILATGIQPNIDLAFHAKLSINKGIRVHDDMRTSDEAIYAIGECAEHRGRIYGVVKPGYEQAKVAAYNLSGKISNYTGSLAATQLKVVGIFVFSMGENDEVSINSIEKEYLYNDKENNVYRRIIVKNRKIIGVISVGEWSEQSRVQEAILNKRTIWFWNKTRFLKAGKLWQEENSDNVNQWPATAVICNCNGITRGQITNVIASGVTTVTGISECTGASAVCGSCKPLVFQMLQSNPVTEKVKWASYLLIFGLVSMFSTLLISVLPEISFSETVQVFWRWDELWRNSLYKQISGFTLLGLSVIVLLMSVRKRIKKFSLLAYPVWRLVHVVVGFIMVFGLVVHSGYSFGSGLNYLLALCFVSLIAAGGVSSVMISLEHRLDAVLARKIKSKMIWLHILAFWPFPALLSVHVFKSYYF